MTGQKIKDILRSEGITIADVARMLRGCSDIMGINACIVP